MRLSVAFLPALAAAAQLGLVAVPAVAAPKPLISYFLPMPVVGKLSTTVWGGSTVGARDSANGLEDNGASGGVGAQKESYFYWDGKIIKGEDGKYHMYASRWQYDLGFGPPVDADGTGWDASIPMQAVSNDVMGPYITQGDCYSKNEAGNDLGHNTTALVTPSGAHPYVLSVGEIVPGQMFASASANGPWALLGATQTNDNGHNDCGTLSSNFTFTVGADQRFWATSRGGCVMDSDQVQGPYKVETNSILPNLENNDNGDAEDEVIWYSGGYYHIVWNYWNLQRGYHIMSKNGVSNWVSTGLAFQGTQSPTNANSKWLRYTDGTVNTWHNMERPSVYQEHGHVTHFTFAVTDVDKNGSGVNRGGSKVLVIPFNGVQFDCDNGDAASCAEIAGGGSAGAVGSAGGANAAGSAGSFSGGGSGAGSGGAPAVGTAGEASASGGAAGNATGSAVSGAAGALSAGAPAAGGELSVAGAGAGLAGAVTSVAGSADLSGAPGAAGSALQAAGGGSGADSGCSCRIGGEGARRDLSAGLGVLGLGLMWRRRRARAA